MKKVNLGFLIFCQI